MTLMAIRPFLFFFIFILSTEEEDTLDCEQSISFPSVRFGNMNVNYVKRAAKSRAARILIREIFQPSHQSRQQQKIKKTFFITYIVRS